MGSLIPHSDPRLGEFILLFEITLSVPYLTHGAGSIDSHESEVNVASDFMALYTTRQKYRRPDISLLDSADGQVFGIDGWPPNFFLTPLCLY
jgi:phosphatidylinositol 4-kinase